MKRRIMIGLAGIGLLSILGAGTTLARADGTVTETCTNGSVTVYTTVDASSVSPGNFEVGSANFANNTPLGYSCTINP